MEGSTRAVWVPAPGATSLGLQREEEVEKKGGNLGRRESKKDIQRIIRSLV